MSQKLTPADHKWIAKFIPYAPELEGKTAEVYNRFSGVKVQTTALVSAITNTVLLIYENLQNARNLAQIHPDLKPTNAVMNFDRGKYIVLKLDSNVYSKIID